MNGIIVIDHGSRKKEANMMPQLMAEWMSRVYPNDYVTYCHLELADPNPKKAIASCLKKNVDKIVFLALFLTPGRHFSEDIPQLAQAHIPEGMPWVITSPLSENPIFVEMLKLELAQWI